MATPPSKWAEVSSKEVMRGARSEVSHLPAIQSTAVVRKTPRTTRSARRTGPSLRQLPRHHLGADLPGEVVAAADAPEHPPDHRQEHDHEGEPHGQELEEGDRGAQPLQETGELGVGRRADLGADPPDVGAVGDRQHDRHAVVGKPPAAELVLDLRDDGDADGHHHRRRGRVRDPERDERRGGEEARQQPPRGRSPPGP